MILSDSDINKANLAGSIVISPFNPMHLQPASMDLELGRQFRYYDHSRIPQEWLHQFSGPRPGSHALDPLDLTPSDIDNLLVEHTVAPRSQICIEPNTFMLGATREWIGLPGNVVGRIEGKSSLARLGLGVHVTAGFVDPGWKGRLTLELFNFSPVPIALTPGMAVAQISFHLMNTAAEKPYGSPGLGSRYQESEGTVTSRYGHKA